MGRTFELHDAEIAEVVSELTEWNWPGMRMVSDEGRGSNGAVVHDEMAQPECVLERWEAEDRRDAEDERSVVELSLAWLGV